MDLALCSDLYFCTCEEIFCVCAFNAIDSRLTTRDTRRVKAQELLLIVSGGCSLHMSSEIPEVLAVCATD